MKSFKSIFIFIVLLSSLVVVTNLKAQTSIARQFETYKPSNYYPPIFFRGATYIGHHCIVLQTKNSVDDEIYFIKQDPSKWIQGKSYDVNVAEFFSGETYVAHLLAESNYRGNLATKNHKVDINCADSDRSIHIGKKEPINSRGDYLTVVNVDTAGSYGEQVNVEVCQVGSHCDIGTQGFVLKDVTDKELWGRVIAIRDKRNYGHPTYKLPSLYGIHTGIFSSATKLLDGTALLSFENLVTIRLTLATGNMEKQTSEVGLVDIQSWAQLKKILNARFLAANNQCKGTAAITECDWQRNTELYFYTLRDYLFPKK